MAIEIYWWLHLFVSFCFCFSFFFSTAFLFPRHSIHFSYKFMETAKQVRREKTTTLFCWSMSLHSFCCDFYSIGDRNIVTQAICQTVCLCQLSFRACATFFSTLKHFGVFFFLLCFVFAPIYECSVYQCVNLCVIFKFSFLWISFVERFFAYFLC